MPIQTASQALNNDVGGSPFGFKNRLINGAMNIDQRFAGTQMSYVYNSGSSAKFCVDRWYCNLFNFSSGTVVYQQQVSDAPVGFSKSLKITAAQNNSGQSFLGGWLQQGIEGYTVADLINESGGLSAVTVSFWVKASKTGTLSVCLESSGDAGVSGTNAHYVSPVTINAINTWEYKTISIPAGTIGSWYKENSGTLVIAFGLCSNGSWLVGTPNQWNNDANRAVLVSNQTNFIASTNDTIQFTGIQLEKGSQATSFDWKPHNTEMQLCERYFEMSYDVGTKPGLASNTLQQGSIGMGCRDNTMAAYNRAGSGVTFRTKKRAGPTVTLYAPGTGTAGRATQGDGGTDISGMSAQQASQSGFNVASTTGFTTGYYTIFIHYTAESEI